MIAQPAVHGLATVAQARPQQMVTNLCLTGPPEA